MSLFNSLKDLVTPELISKASSFLGEDSSKVTSAVSSAIPSLLGSLLQAGDSPKLGSVLQEAGNNSKGILSGLGNMFSGGESDSATGSIGSGFLNAILGDKLSSFTSLISSFSGISSGSSGKLISALSPMIAGFLGGKMKSEGLNLGGLLKMVGADLGSFKSLIPSGLSSVLGISSLDSLGSNILGSVSGAAKEVGNVASNVSKTVEKGANKSASLLKWLLLPLLAIAAAFLIWRSCSVPKVDTTAIQNQVNTTINNVADKIKSQIALPNGMKIEGLQGGFEEKMVTFLNSDAYSDATNEELREKWFDFDNINFELGTTTLTAESQPQIQNIVAILKHYTDAKIKIGAYTDKTGNPELNLKLSQSRADAIREMLSEAGVGSQIAESEGYGSAFAKVAAEASDDERAVDRKVSIRFVK